VPVALLGLLKLCLLALVYLFFVRVLWAVWSEVRTPVSTAPNASASARSAATGQGDRGGAAHGRVDGDGVAPVRPLAASHLVILAPESHQGVTIALGDEVTVGRAANCSLSLPTDTFLSSLHARVFEQDGATHVEDLGSTNGTWVNDERITDPVTVRTGDRVQVGGTVLEVA
jgi:FHA domain